MVNGMTHKKQIQEIRRLIEMVGGRCYVTSQVGRLYGSAGIPDLLCFAEVRGEWRVFFVEVKVGRDKLSDAQRAFREECLRARVPYVVGRVGDVADFMGLTQGEVRC